MEQIEELIERSLEQWFGIGPDSGDGRLELLLNLVMIAAAAWLVVAGSRHPGSRILRWFSRAVSGLRSRFSR